MTFTRKAKIDANQPEIVNKLQQIGCTVKSVAQLKGFCDIVVGINGRNYLFEIKDENKPPSQKRLTDKEWDFINTWKGQINVIENFDQALEIINRR